MGNNKNFLKKWTNPMETPHSDKREVMHTTLNRTIDGFYSRKDMRTFREFRSLFMTVLEEEIEKYNNKKEKI